MSGEPAIIALLRESLEAEVSASLAAGALLRSLARRGPGLPGSFLEVVELVQGPLREDLARHLGPRRAAEIVTSLERRLRLAEMPTGTLEAAPRASFADAPTHALRRPKGPVRLRVVAGSTLSEVLIVCALGPHRVVLSDEPTMLLLDAEDPPGSWGADLERCAHAAETTLIYGIELEAGRSAAARLTSAGLPFQSFAVEHGVAPILDVIRSRVA